MTEESTTPAAPVIQKRWWLPSAVADELDPGASRRSRRTARDWAVDFCAFALAALIGFGGNRSVGHLPGVPDTWAVADQALGVLSCVALWWRRRWPVALAVAMIPIGLVSNTCGGALVVLLFTLAVHRPFRYVAWVAGIQLALTPLYDWLRPDPTMSYGASVAFASVVILSIVGWGMFTRSKRQLVLSLRDRARSAETEAQLRAEQAQRLAREAIAREMHDVLAHRLTLLSVHAGAVEFRPDAPQAEIKRAAQVIRASAHEALQDLREIIGVLRTGDAEEPGRPQPTLAALDGLVAEARAAGMEVVLAHEVAEPERVSASMGRTAYRIVQEALTNARKHAPGAPVTVRVVGGLGSGLALSVRNPAPVGPVPHVPGSGQGLIGLKERALLAGGELDGGPVPGGGFELRARLPW
ncbi:sensor histidine kinase [Kitasatospora sp. NPDC058965]|uniref:sensor histidine kinase n=1 Tax=Kitasatospora sp. NPDC058965 TaxID=3346682 RepID=UPI003697BFE8